MKNSEQPAFPTLTYEQNQGGIFQYEFGGLTKREHFAGLAMQGLMTKDWVKLHIDDTSQGKSGYTNIKMIVDISVQMADELLKQLEAK